MSKEEALIRLVAGIEARNNVSKHRLMTREVVIRAAELYKLIKREVSND